MALQADVYADVIVSTLKDLGRFKWTDLTTTRRNFIALPKILNSDKPVTRTGYGIQWPVKIGTVGTFRNVGLGVSQVYNTADTHKTATAPWRHSTANYPFVRQVMQ